MPTSAKRFCAHAGCSALVSSGRCEAHTKAKQKDYDDRRGTRTQRGYDNRWLRYRAWFLERNPFCGDRPMGLPPTGDSQCVAQGRHHVLATVVDHIVPVRGPHDPSFYVTEGHQSLCESCHAVKRQRESRTTTGGR